MTILLFAGCAAQEREKPGNGYTLLPPVTPQPTHIYHPGKFVWHDLITPDATASCKFYKELFGWTFTQQGGYIQIFNGKAKIGGIVDKKEYNGLWVPVVRVADPKDFLDKVESLNGSVLVKPEENSAGHNTALISDNTGALIMLQAWIFPNEKEVSQ